MPFNGDFNQTKHQTLCEANKYDVEQQIFIAFLKAQRYSENEIGNVTGNDTRIVADNWDRGIVLDNLTIIDVADLAGVSVSTVSRVLNNHPDVSKKTREKVMAIINEHTYIPNNSARSLKRESIKAVAVIVKGFSNPFFTSMLTVIQQELEENRYIAMLHQVDPNQDEVEAAISLCKEKKPRALIFMGGNFQHSRDKLARLNVPYVMLTITMHKNVDRGTFSSVAIDDYAASYRVGEAICKAGHKSFGVISSYTNDKSISRLRLDGFKKALQDNGLQLNEKAVAYAGQFSRAAGYEAAKQLMQTAKFTALFCISDILALGAIRAIHDEGYSVPEDISVIGFDGIDEGRYSIPSLATVKQPGMEMAYECVQILLNQLRKGSPHEHMVFKETLLDGESFYAPNGINGFKQG